MMGAAGLTAASEVAILNANYLAKKLAPHYPVLYSGPGGLVAHECILDLRPIKETQRHHAWRTWPSASRITVSMHPP